MTFVIGALFGWAVVKVSDWARARWGWGWLYVQAVEHGRRLATAEHKVQVQHILSELVILRATVERPAIVDPSTLAAVAVSEGSSVAGAGT